MAGMRPHHALWWALGSAVLMVIGSFGPWAKIFVFSANGTDGDGWIVILAALAAAGALWRYWFVRTRVWLVIAFLGGVAGVATTVIDRINLQDVIDRSPFGGLLRPGWGIYAAMLGSASLCAAVAALWVLRAEPTAATPAPSPPAQP